MRIILIAFIIYLSVSDNISLKDGIYKITFMDLYLNYRKGRLCLTNSNSAFKRVSTSFRFIYVESNLSIKYFFIESVENNEKLFIQKKEVKTQLNYEKKIDDKFFWSIIKKNETSFLLSNKNGCHLNISNKKIINCVDSIEEASELNLIKVYEEVNNSEADIKLIEKEPIDVLIKYIDLRDPLLKRTSIHQIDKDLENEELRYSVRSILKYIPWVRKIFILMPNEKVRYFKDYEEIKEKIVYVKDKDLSGFDSSSSLVFQFRYWKMKDFNMSDNFIAMDDDCFIGKPLKKSDFFYVQDNKVVPLIITNRFLRLTKEEIKQSIDFHEKKTLNLKREQSFNAFQYSKYLTYSLITREFETPLIVPKFTHNAIPVNVHELKKIYDMIYDSEFKNATLFSNFRHIQSLQFQSFVLGYTFNKYHKKVKNLSNKYISFEDSIKGNYDYQLFCVNTNSYNNSEIGSKIYKIVMEKLFPRKSPYEIVNYSLSSFAFDAVKQLQEEEIELKKELSNKRTIKVDNLMEEKLKNQLKECNINCNKKLKIELYHEILAKNEKKFFQLLLIFLLIIFFKHINRNFS